MSKIYIVADACSGKDYHGEIPRILFVTDSYEKARKFFSDEISNWESKLKYFNSFRNEYNGETKLVYKCTSFKKDLERIMKLVEKEIQ